MKWEVFTQEERVKIESLAKDGQWDLITSAVLIREPEQEYWLNVYIDENKPISSPLESTVREELEKELASDPLNVLTTPEQEAEWQKKLDEEKAKHEETIKKDRKKRKYKKEEEVK